jgi:hypothetical protein
MSTAAGEAVIALGPDAAATGAAAGRRDPIGRRLLRGQRRRFRTTREEVRATDSAVSGPAVGGPAVSAPRAL